MLVFVLFWAAHAADRSYLPRAVGFATPRTCRAVDYRAELGPARTQGDSSYCFAFSSANLLTQRSGVDASALDLATGFYFGKPAAFRARVTPAVARELGPAFLAILAGETYRPGVDVTNDLAIFPNLEGGFEASTLAWANARGVCADRRLPSDGGTDRYRALFARFTADAHAGRRPAGTEVDGISPRFRSNVADRVNTAWLRFAARRCRGTPAPVAVLPVDFALTGTSRDFRRLRGEGRLGEADQTRVLAALDFALDHRRVAAIGFDLNTVQAHEGYVEEDGDHSVTVVGRRTAPDGACQYLIRDSAGDACGAFTPAVRARCEGRHYWLTEEELRRSLYSVTYLR